MKKVIYCIIIIVILSISLILLKISNNNADTRKRINYNAKYEQYLNKEIYGTDALTIINRAIDNNETNAIPKDEDGLYEENNENVIKVEIILLAKTEENGQEKIEERAYPMEALQKVGLEGFLSSFNLTTFKCTDIKYNVQGKVNKIVLKQLEI